MKQYEKKTLPHSNQTLPLCVFWCQDSTNIFLGRWCRFGFIFALASFNDYCWSDWHNLLQAHKKYPSCSHVQVLQTLIINTKMIQIHFNRSKYSVFNNRWHSRKFSLPALRFGAAYMYFPATAGSKLNALSAIKVPPTFLKSDVYLWQPSYQ